ncbi:hypothetical protein QYM36_005464 [Artemia franciscana]|uniref:Uncharacterized protein n=1 Tax=Artemia franciscana TaxID=6661 RepID=A0AA88HXW3_ARTSF|nr:hypothetical protein QYM36_005464 [Artemia franciscana]
MPSIQVTSPLSEYDCEPDLWDVDSDSEKELQSKEQFLNKEKSSQKWELLRNPGLGMATSKIPILKWKMKMVSFQ